MLYYSLWLPITLTTLLTARALGFDWRSLAIIGLAIALYYLQFYRSTWELFSVDSWPHADYIRYIATHNALPPTEAGIAFRHPPTYYILGAMLYRLAQLTDNINPLYAVRHLSMALYLIFILFSALTLRRLLPSASHVYYMALAMVCFWPVGVVMGGRIICDLLQYAGEMGVLYFLICWLQEYKIKALSGAFLCSGIAVLGKNAAVLFFGLSLLFLAQAVWLNRHQWKKLLAPHLLGSVGFASACLYATLARDAVGPLIAYKPPSYSLSEFLHTFVFFDPMLFLNETIFNPQQGESKIRFWNWFLRSMILGDFIQWKALFIIFAFGCVWLAMICYMLYGVLVPKIIPKQEKTILCFLAMVAALMIGMLMYMRFKFPDIPGTADARYIYPIIPLTVLCFTKTMEWHQKAGREFAFRIGNGLAIGFILLTLLLFITQDVLLTRMCCDYG